MASNPTANNDNKGKKKIFVSFDFDNDRDLKNEMVAFSQNEDANFKVSNWSMKPVDMTRQWEKQVKYHITRCDVLVVLIGEQTADAPGVKHEIEIARANNIKIIQMTSHPQHRVIDAAGQAHDLSLESISELLG